MSDVGWSERLRARARELDLADAEVARRIGLSQGRYQNYVAGRREPDFATLLRICNVLQTTPDVLLGVVEGSGGEDVASRSIAASLAAMGATKLNLAATLLRALASHDLAVGGDRSPGDSVAKDASVKKASVRSLASKRSRPISSTT